MSLSSLRIRSVGTLFSITQHLCTNTLLIIRVILLTSAMDQHNISYTEFCRYIPLNMDTLSRLWTFDAPHRHLRAVCWGYYALLWLRRGIAHRVIQHCAYYLSYTIWRAAPLQWLSHRIADHT